MVCSNLKFTDTKLRSKLSSILAACFTYTKDFKHGLSSNFNKLVAELIKLEEEGIRFIINGVNTQVYFVITYIHGDNLGINIMLGYTKNFRLDGCCRTCVATYSQIKSLVEEDPSLLRYVESNRMNTIGVEQTCPFEDIQSFYTEDNSSADVFHDINEGILHKELIFAMKYFRKKGFVDLNTINTKKNNFKFYTAAEKKNLCQDIKKEHLRGKNKKLRMSGSEIATFFKYFPIFVGEFIPSNNEVWLMIMSLYNLMNKAYKDSFSRREIEDLKSNIKEHHTLYKAVTSKPLTFKHHIIVHYPAIIRRLSLPKQMSTIRMEGFHKVSKAYSNCTSCRKNILLSIAEKHQFHHIYEITKDKIYQIPSVHCRIKNLDATDLFRNPSFIQSIANQEILYYKTLKNFDITYNISNAIQHNGDFLQINYIITLNGKAHLICSKLKLSGEDSHLSCNTVEILNNCDHVVVNVENLASLPYSCFEYKINNSLHQKKLTLLMINNF